MNAQTVSQKLANGRALGHTHAVHHVPGRGSVTVNLDSVPTDTDARFVKTGFPAYAANHNRHAYDPVVVGVTDTQDGGYLDGLTKFANQP